MARCRDAGLLAPCTGPLIGQAPAGLAEGSGHHYQRFCVCSRKADAEILALFKALRDRRCPTNLAPVCPGGLEYSLTPTLWTACLSVLIGCLVGALTRQLCQ